MRSLPKTAGLATATVALALALTVANPAPEAASANLPCDAVNGPVESIAGAVGIGNPVGDACNAVTEPVIGLAGKALQPLKEAASSIGQGIFNQITEWVAGGASWLVGQVVVLTDETTSPNLLSRGFLAQYDQMALIAAALGALMLVFAVVDSLGRGDSEGLVRVFLVSVPLAAIATSAAYVVVQLLIATTDGFSHAIAASTAHNTHDFFKGAVQALSKAGAATGAAAGAATQGPGGAAAGAGGGAVAVPLFVGFIAAVIAAFAALAVWVELLMRDAAIYAVALFMPLALAASIWPRWASALRRTCELVVVVVFSKFVIVAIIALATSLLAHTAGQVEHVLAAAALLLLACFAPFVLFRLVPFAEGAIGSLYNRQSAAGAGVRSVEFASSVQMMRRAALANWAMNSTRGGGSSSGGSGGASGGGGGSSGSRGGKPAGSGGGAGGAKAGGASGAVALPASAGLAAASASKGAAAHLAASGTAQGAQASGRGASESTPDSTGARGGAQSAPRAVGTGQSQQTTGSPGSEPSDAEGGKAPAAQSKPPRPGGEVKTAGGAGHRNPTSGGSAA